MGIQPSPGYDNSSALLRYLFETSQRRYKLFISHAWDYGEEYEALVKLLNAAIGFYWDNYSVPEERPLPTLIALPKSYRCLVQQLDARITQSDCLLVIARMYVAHRQWIQSEIEAAKEFRKPVIAVEPRGSELFPNALADTADERVGWNCYSIVSAIRRAVYPAPPVLFSTIPTGGR